MASDLFQLAMEDWNIWKRWERAFHAGETSHDSHPALPADRARHLEIEAVLDTRVKTDIASCLVRAAAFVNAGPVRVKGILADLLVRFSERSDEEQSIWAD